MHGIMTLRRHSVTIVCPACSSIRSCVFVNSETETYMRSCFTEQRRSSEIWMQTDYWQMWNFTKRYEDKIIAADFDFVTLLSFLTFSSRTLWSSFSSWNSWPSRLRSNSWCWVNEEDCSNRHVCNCLQSKCLRIDDWYQWNEPEDDNED